MTADAVLTPTPGASAPAPTRGRRFSLPVLLLAIAGALVALAAVRTLTGANDLTSNGAVRAALQSAIPIGLAGLGGLWAERAGVVNIGLEGQLIFGTWFGAWAGYHWGPWVGVLAAIAGGALGGLLHALATVTFGVDHIVSGVAITILAGGVARYLSQLAFKGLPGGGVTQSPPVPELPRWSVPGVSSLDGLERKHWFLLSDLAGILRGALTEVSALTVIAALLVPLTFWVLWRTPFGLRLRSCGENPKAAESLGVNVYRYKYYGVVISGALAGLGGAFLSMVASTIYREGQTGGRGYIGLAAMIFGNWRPGGLASGALLFGYTDALQLRGGSKSVHALLLFLALLLLAVGVWQLVRRRLAVGAIAVVVALLVGVWYATTDSIPGEFVQAAPHITTLVVLALASQRLRMPAADGQRYRRGG
ncbi:ABC transporter permease [Planosporangium mesophilum]|uniref:ABC transporter permease n=1 Tax=Planosporangium mesophilum TaxID=689768 RepID=A0A8J3T9P6_9ACTN|nr:ABC transporter permease [Planosporangium mesophilum]NJC81157.1 ABC transporter permease [Planosporangium mesophilum]GII21192.1 ABC transporter permease [Planosporangium mesophilum]